MPSPDPTAPGPAEPELPAMDRSVRFDRLRSALADRELDGIVVTKPVNIRWLCGFTGSNGVLAVTTDRAVLVTDARYTDQAGSELDTAAVAVEIRIDRDLFGSLRDVFDAAVGFESNHLTVAEHATLEAALGSLSSTQALVEDLRQVKDEGEIGRLRAAAAIADQAFAAVMPLLEPGALDPGLTERRFGAELDHHMRLAGAEDLSFETIVGSGPNGALPHARPSTKVIEAGDLVVLDFGASIDGYGSDMTRTVVAGAEPTEEQADLYDAVSTAQRLGVAAVADGVAQSAIDAACRQSLSARGYGDAFTHGTGHGIGLEIHEAPILSARSVGILRSGLVVTVEPGAYLPGFGGVRVEDSVLVTADGCEPLTHSPKGLLPSFQGTAPWR